MKLSDEQIQRLSDAGFKWSLNSGFDDRFNDLMAFKAKNGHCNVSTLGDDAFLGKWCSELRRSYKIKKLSDEQIQRLSDAGFKWAVGTFDDHFNDLMAFKAKNGHCNVSKRGENVSLGKWCSELRRSYKIKKLSDEQIQCLNDAGFKWAVGTFDDRFNDLMAFKAKNDHCNVSKRGENASLGKWCSEVRGAYTKIQNKQQKPRMKLSDEQIQCLNAAGFKWRF